MQVYFVTVQNLMISIASALLDDLRALDKTMQHLNDIRKHNPHQWLIGGGVTVCETATPSKSYIYCAYDNLNRMS